MLELADRLVARSDGGIEDVWVQMGTLILLVYFVSLDFEPDSEIHFILGCPFLFTSGALIDVADDRMTISLMKK